MNSMGTLDFPYVPQMESEKIINFSFYTLQVVRNRNAIGISFGISFFIDASKPYTSP
jgi:hypothetical protein